MNPLNELLFANLPKDIQEIIDHRIHSLKTRWPSFAKRIEKRSCITQEAPVNDNIYTKLHHIIERPLALRLEGRLRE